MSWFAEKSTFLRRRWIAGAAMAALGILLCRVAVSAEAEDGPDAVNRLGMLIRIDLPITGKTADRVEGFVDRALDKAGEDAARLVLIFELYVPPGQEEFAAGTEFSDAWKLADILSGRTPGAARTVAYLPQSIRGHALLVALACDEIMMPGDAELGPVGAKPETIGPTERSAYKEIADRRMTIPAEVALWLLDPSQEVLKVETDLGRRYVFRKDLEDLEQERTITSSKPLRELVEGQPGRFTGQEARRLNFVDRLVPTPEEVAEALDLPAKALEQDPLLVSEPRAAQINLKGPINYEMVRQAQRALEELREVNFVCLWIESPGGSLTDSIELAKTLADLDSSKILTVAYVPTQARSDAALIALACDEVVVHPRAELGGSGDGVLSEEDVEYAKEIIRDENGPWKKSSWSLVAAMIDPKLEVFECKRLGKVGYFCNDELDEHPHAEEWQKGMPVTRPGEPLLIDGRRAVEYGLADETAENFAEFKQIYGLEEDPALMEPGWADFLIEALASPGVSAVLLMIAFLAMYAELHAPGIGVGGFVATVCFLLFFWSHYLEGSAGWLEIILFLAGVGCLVLEVFVLPGFGIFGLGGGSLVLVSLILASQTFVFPGNDYQWEQQQRSLLTIAAAGVLIVGAAGLLRRWLPHAPIFKRMMLEPPEGEEAEDISRRESLVDLDDFVGTRGTTTTQLTPSGKARFGDRLVDVITDGDVVPRGTQIEVVEVHGNRVVVRAVDSG